MVVQKIIGNCFRSIELIVTSKEDQMKIFLTLISAAFLVTTFGFSANAMTSAKPTAGYAQMRKECQAQAAQKYTAVHFVKRNKYVSACMNKRPGKRV
jgi:hypothetical protein